MNSISHAFQNVIALAHAKFNLLATCADPDGVGGGAKNHINIGCLSKTGPDPLKITKLPSWAIIGTPAKRHLNKWRFAYGPMMASPHQIRKKKALS